ncbi:ArdC family protein [Paracoccus pacificus]|uniref:ArdC family protein n=1 Tax=Paracoccus pacificus TaxID=1463598 RepID=A0ABW4R719_9RHOB
MAQFDVYQHVTDQIIASLEAGTPVWRKPWTGDAGGIPFPRRSTGEHYRGINILMLWAQAAEHGYRSAHWFTYRQAQHAGAQVRKGEKSATVVKYGTVERTDAETGEEKTIGYAKAYRVFNAEQIDGLPEDFHAKPVEAPRDLGTETDPALDAFFDATGIERRTSERPEAFYDVAGDFIHMPPVATFHDAAGYYATLAHESCHATGAVHRLDRFSRFNGRTDRAFEELVAELGQVMVCAQLGLTPDFKQSAAYIASWLLALKHHKRMIFKAATEAQKAADWLMKTAPAGMIEERAAA